MDIEKSYGNLNPACVSLSNGRKSKGLGSREVIEAMEDIEMDNIAIIEDQDFRVDVELFNNPSFHHKYFMVKATKAPERED